MLLQQFSLTRSLMINLYQEVQTCLQSALLRVSELEDSVEHQATTAVSRDDHSIFSAERVIHGWASSGIGVGGDANGQETMGTARRRQIQLQSQNEV